MASVTLAYFLWFFFGVFGIHHLYLGRTTQAVLYGSTLGCLFFGWIRDSWRIPEYVRQANFEAMYISELKSKLSTRPRVSFARGCAMFLSAYFFSKISLGLIGTFQPTHILNNATSTLRDVPLWWIILCGVVSTIGIVSAISLVGNVGGQYTANYRYVTLGALLGVAIDLVSSYPEEEKINFFFRIIFPIVVHFRVREWVPASTHIPSFIPNRCSSLLRALFVYSLALTTIFSLTCLYIYQYTSIPLTSGFSYYADSSQNSYENNTIFDLFTPSSSDFQSQDFESHANPHGSPNINLNTTDSYTKSKENSKYTKSSKNYKYSSNIRVKTVFQNIANSPVWKEFKHLTKICLSNYFEHGYCFKDDKVWKYIFEKLDFDGSGKAREVLGVDKDISLEDLNKRKRELMKKYHPDRNKDKEAAAIKFNEISEAFNLLENLIKLRDKKKLRKKTRNKNFDDNIPHEKLRKKVEIKSRDEL